MVIPHSPCWPASARMTFCHAYFIRFCHPTPDIHTCSFWSIFKQIEDFKKHVNDCLVLSDYDAIHVPREHRVYVSLPKKQYKRPQITSLLSHNQLQKILFQTLLYSNIFTHTYLKKIVYDAEIGQHSMFCSLFFFFLTIHPKCLCVSVTLF